MSLDISQMPNVDPEKIFFHIKKLSMFEKIAYYIIDSEYRRTVNLRTWIKAQLDNPSKEMIAIADKFKNIKNVDKRMIEILKFWIKELPYKDDKSNYNKYEYWATANEIIEKKSDDCEGFMTVIYITARLAGISDSRLYCVAGSVKIFDTNLGHAYLVYIANNLQEYPIDGSFYPEKSVLMKVRYTERPEYNNGSTEWFRFNSTGSYIKR